MIQLPPRLNGAVRRFERRAWLRALLVKEARAGTELAEEQLEHDIRTQRGVLGLTRSVDGVRPSNLGAAEAWRARVDEEARCLEGQRWRNQRLRPRLEQALGLHCRAQAAIALLWSPEGRCA